MSQPFHWCSRILIFETFTTNSLVYVPCHEHTHTRTHTFTFSLISSRNAYSSHPFSQRRRSARRESRAGFARVGRPAITSSPSRVQSQTENAHPWAENRGHCVFGEMRARRVAVDSSIDAVEFERGGVSIGFAVS